jgi:hypothetical protein
MQYREDAAECEDNENVLPKSNSFKLAWQSPAVDEQQFGLVMHNFQ